MRLTVILLSALLSAVTPGRRAADGLSFTPLKSESISSEEVSSLLQDSEGFIWIVTYDGLVRFDGYQTTSFSLHNDGEEFFDGYLHMATEEDETSLLVGTERGLLRLDKRTGVLSRLRDPAFEYLNVTDMVKDNDGRIWVSGDKGIFFKDRTKDSFTRLDLRTTFRENTLTDIIDLLFDGRGNLWITSWHKGLYRYSLNTGRLYSYCNGALGDAYVLYIDRKGALWIGTWGSGLLKADTDGDIESTLPYESFVHDKQNPNSLLDNIIYDIDEDENGRIWIGSRSGLSILDNGTFTNFYPDNGTGSLPYNEVNSILRARDNTMWLGMLGGGVCKASIAKEDIFGMPMGKVREEYKTSSVRSIFRAGPSTYWLGISGHGMIKYNSTDGGFINYMDVPEFKGFLYTSTVDAIIGRRESSEICFGSYDKGLWIFNQDNGSTKVINSTTSRLGNDCILSLCEDRDNNLWIGTKNGAYILDSSDNVTSLAEWLNSENLSSNYTVLDMDVDRKGNMWLATGYDGILKISAADRQVTSYRIQGGAEVKGFNSILADSAGNVWAGAVWNGLYMYNPKKNTFEKAEEFVFMEDKAVHNIAESADGRIWVTTGKQVAAFSYDGVKFDRIWYRNISEDTDIFFNRNSSMYIADRDVMAFGCSRGIIELPCSMESDDSTGYPVAITGLNAGGKTYENANYMNRITLPNDCKEVSVKFSMLDFNNPKGDIYRYRLARTGSRQRNDKGLEWMIVNGDRNEASFHNLSPGRYVFEVCGSKSDGYMVGKYKKLEIKVMHNPWLSWWAIMVYAVAGLVAIRFIIKGIRSRIALKRKIEYEQINAQKTEEVDQAKLRFFTNVSHEFLTPLSIIMASVESLEPKNDADRKITGIMADNAIRLTRLVQQVLEFRKVESDNLKLKVSRNDAAEFIGSCVEAFLPLVRKRNLSISFEAEPLSIKGWYDPDKLDKIMYNLISNAVKYTPEGGHVKVTASGDGKDNLIVRCANDGELMNKSTLRGLFKRFYEGDYRKFSTIGTGIGLSLVKSLVEIHKGKITVTSDETNGNCFTVSLPIGRDSYSEDEIDTDTVPNVPLAFSMGESFIKDSHTVLFVDDNDDVLSTFSVIMSKRFNVLTCNNGTKAIEILSEGGADVAVVDVNMPGINGFELCHTIKGNVETSHIPVIMLTARDDDSSRIEGYGHGADGYMSKPCNFSVLSAMIRNLIKRQENKSADFRKQLVFEVAGIDYTSTDKKFLQQAIDVVNSHISDSEFSQTDFVNAMSVSRTVLTEKLKSLTGFTPTAFILNARLTLAYNLVMNETDKIRVSDLAYSVGFSDAKYFSKKFKSKFGLSPKEMMDEKEKNSQKA